MSQSAATESALGGSVTLPVAIERREDEAESLSSAIDCGKDPSYDLSFATESGNNGVRELVDRD